MEKNALGNPVGPGPIAERSWLGDIALFDPVLAYTLLAGAMAPGGYVDVGGWEVLNLVGRFESGAANTVVPGDFNGIIEADLWVRKVTYTVRRPNAFAGNVLKAQSDYYNAKNPNIDFTLTVNSYCRYLISPQQTPLENIEMAFEANAPAGMVLRCSSRIDAQYTLLRALADDEIPTEAVITLHATRLPNNSYGMCQRDQAAAVLQNLGYLPKLPQLT